MVPLQEGLQVRWGNSDDMLNHVKNHKHQRNFQAHLPRRPRIVPEPLSKNELIEKA